MNEIINKEDVIAMDNIKLMIMEIREKQVILDSDVAKLYDYEVRVINQTVKRNIKRFPEEFCFQLTEEEYYKLLRSQIATLKDNVVLRSQIVILKTENGSGKHRKYLPYVFTQEGIGMLSGLLKNDIAVEVSVHIMKAFVEMRKFIKSNAIIFDRLVEHELKLLEHDNSINKLFNELQINENIKQKIFYNGQIYDAYSIVIDIIKQAKIEIIIIDNYIDKTVLDLLSNKNDKVNVTIIGKNSLNLSKLDIHKFNEQYPSLIMNYSNEYHDRFIIIDKDIIYHLGASLKDIGKKTFAISIMEDKTLLDKLF